MLSKLKNFFRQDSIPFKTRLMLSLFIGIAFSFTFVLFGYLDIYVSNVIDIGIVLPKVLIITFVCWLIGAIVISGVLLLLKGKLFTMAVSLVIGILLSGYLQGSFFNLSVGTLTGDAVDWSKYTTATIINTIIWLVIMAAPFVLRRINAVVWRKTVLFICVLLVGMQGCSLAVNMMSTNFNFSEPNKYLSYEKDNEMSTKRNVIVFIVDRLDYEYIDAVREIEPDFFSRLDGFTDFTNATSLYSRTYPASTYLMTGVKSFFDKPIEQYFDEAWSSSAFIQTLRENNYTTKYNIKIGVTYSNIEQLIGKADNIKEDKSRFSWRKASTRFARLSMYRYVPDILKPVFWVPEIDFHSAYTAKDMVVSNRDELLYSRLVNSGLTTQSKKNNFLYLHMNGCHPPFTMDENAQPIEVSEDENLRMGQIRGCFKILYDYMDEMKKLGLYKDATIIITGDHGISTDKMYMETASTIGYFVKPSGSADTPLEQNNAPVSHDNLLATILKSEDLDYSEFGISAFDVPQNSDGVRSYYYWGDIKQNHANIEEFEIIGDAKDFSNWRKVGEKQTSYLTYFH